MKYATLILTVLLLSCDSSSDSTEEVTTISNRDALTGAWRMTNFLRITNEGDTIDDHRVQYKMYVDGSVMWGFEAPEKYTEWFGYGTYYIDGDTLYETMTSGSWAFRQAIAQESNFFQIGIDIKENEYTQVIVSREHTSYETYERVN